MSTSVIKNSSNYTLLTTVSLSTASTLGISIPEGATDLLLYAVNNGTVLHVPTSILTTLGRYYQTGFYLSASNYAGFASSISKTKIGYTTNTKNGEFSATDIEVYYK